MGNHDDGKWCKRETPSLKLFGITIFFGHITHICIEIEKLKQKSLKSSGWR